MPPTSDDVRQNLLKLRKGAAAWLNERKLEAIFCSLNSGWTLEKQNMYLPTTQVSALPDRLLPISRSIRVDSVRGSKVPLLDAYAYSHEEIEAYRDELDLRVCGSLPDVNDRKSPKALVSWIGNIEERKPFSSTQYALAFQVHLKVRGTVLVSPDGQAFQVCPSQRQLGNGAITFADWFDWARENTGFMDEVLEALGMEAHVPARQQGRQPSGGQTIGTCAICDCEHVIQKEAMVLHGYQRPGIGMIVGNCFGAGRPPYEMSPQACEDYVPILKRMLSDAERTLAKLEANKVDSFQELDLRFRDRRIVVIDRSHPKFEMVRRTRVREGKSQIANLTKMVDEMNRKIAIWQERKLKTSPEHSDEKIEDISFNIS